MGRVRRGSRTAIRGKEDFSVREAEEREKRGIEGDDKTKTWWSFTYILCVKWMMSLLSLCRFVLHISSHFVWGGGVWGFLCIGGQVIPTPGTREIIERMAWGIFLHMLFLILVSCCFLLSPSFFTLAPLHASFFYSCFRVVRVRNVKGKIPLMNTIEYHSFCESICELTTFQ